MQRFHVKGISNLIGVIVSKIFANKYLERLLCTPILVPSAFGTFYLIMTIFCVGRAVLFTPEYFMQPAFLIYQILGSTIACFLLYWARLIFKAKAQTDPECEL